MISIVIPSRNDDIEVFQKTINAIKKQTVLPKEIIIVDSSTDNSIKNFLQKQKLKLINLIYKKIDGSFAGKSTNIGMSLATQKFIGLLDTKTIPNDTWIEKYIKQLERDNSDLIFGNTKFFSKNRFQKILRILSYGDASHETVPGTIFKRSKFGKKMFFIENVRSSYDIEWRERQKTLLKTSLGNEIEIEYGEFPNSFLDAAKKYFIYSFYTAIVNVQKDAKDLYLSIFIILSALVIPRWNFFLEGWDENPLYIADVTKKYFLSLLVIFLSFLIASRFFPKQVENRLPFITLKYTVFLFIFLSVFNWNAVVADWVEDTVFYIPHITKIFVVLVLVSSVLVRGLFKPVSNKVKLNYLLPFRWLFIGTIGVILDIVKAPGYIIGSLISKFR